MLVCVFANNNCTRDRGCSAHPVFPAPSCFSRAEIHAKLGRIAPRDCGRTSSRCSIIEAENSHPRRPGQVSASERRSGTHTHRPIGETQGSDIFVNNKRPGLWVPAPRAQLRTRQGRRSENSPPRRPGQVSASERRSGTHTALCPRSNEMDDGFFAKLTPAAMGPRSMRNCALGRDDAERSRCQSEAQPILRPLARSYPFFGSHP